MKQSVLWFIFLFIAAIIVARLFLTATPKTYYMGRLYKLYSCTSNNQAYLNEYLPKGKTFEDTNMIISIYQIPYSQGKDAFTEEVYNKYFEKGVTTKSKISDKISYLRFCTAVPIPEKHAECSYYNIQNGENNTVLVYQFTKRYYPKDYQNFDSMTQNLMSEETVIKPQIIEAKMPKIITKTKNEQATHGYYLLTDKNNLSN